MDLEGHLYLLCDSLSPSDAAAAVDTLKKIVQNAVEHPGEERYRRLRTANKTFSQRVWRHPPAQQLMAAMGWIEVEGDVILPTDGHLQEALLELTKTQSVLEEQMETEHKELQQPTKVTTSVSSHQERMRKLRETQKKVEEERKRIAEQIKADRQETSKKESRASQSRQLKFGGNVNRFEDIGVDLNAGGG